jgi:hypothetical protein
MPPNLQPVPDRQLPTAERLAQLHEALASAGDPHDVILEIGRIGDASSVSFLIEALRNLASARADLEVVQQNVVSWAMPSIATVRDTVLGVTEFAWAVALLTLAGDLFIL